MATDPEPRPEAPAVSVERPAADAVLVRLRGDWTVGSRPPGLAPALAELERGDARRVTFDAAALGAWDSVLPTAVLALERRATQRGLCVERDGLPEGVRRLLALATAVPERAGARRAGEGENVLAQLGGAALGAWASTRARLEFLGETTLSLGRLVTGRARLRLVDLVQLTRRAGYDALPIVSLVSLLVGLILAFVGAVQLRVFGAQIYVASLVGVAMVRVMAAVMTAVIVAGRTGAAFAAELGTMQVNEEVDALETLGFSSFDFLVLPRMLALGLMMPLLCLYANVMGIAGGFVVGVGLLGLSPTEYWLKTKEAVDLTNLGIGLIHGAVFGLLVAFCGCFEGMRCGRSASSVGVATTTAVVSSIVGIVVVTALITWVCDVLGV